jgi:nucleotide-binding universal stress UspA family protein
MKNKKIIWAVDVFQDLRGGETAIVKTLKNLQRTTGAKIIPVYVLSPEQLDVGIEFSPPWEDYYVPAARKALEQYLKDAGVPNIGTPKVLVHSRPSVTGSTQMLANYAKLEGADMIAVSSHGRKGLARIFMGSFAESLLLQSVVPTLVIGPHTEAGEPTQNILFPTDLEEAGFPAFRRAVDLARELKVKVTLLHSLPDPIEPVFQSGVYLLGGGWVPVSTYYGQEQAKRAEIAQSWVKRAEARDVSIEVIIDRQSHSILSSILEHSKSLANCLVTMPAYSGAISSALLGSITRQVVRNATCPVWVFRPEKKSESK